MRCVVRSKGQYPARAAFSCSEGNAKGISVELPLKDKTESGLTRKKKKKKNIKKTHLLANELNGLASSDGFNVRTLL